MSYTVTRNVYETSRLTGVTDAFDLLAVFKCFLILLHFSAKIALATHNLQQGSSNLSLEVQSAAEFSSNPDQTHLPVIF